MNSEQSDRTQKGVSLIESRFKWDLKPNKLSLLLEEKYKIGARILDLTESNPTRVGFDYPVAEMLAALQNPAAITYQPEPKGLLVAREAVANYYLDAGISVSPDHIHLTCSTSEGYSYLFKLLASHGDEVLVPQPSYPLFDFLASLEGVELRPYQLSYHHPFGWSIDFDSLRAAITDRTRAVIVVNPNNPTGSFVANNERERLLTLAAERDLPLIVDEVFADYGWGAQGLQDHSFAASGKALTFVLSGLSKVVGLPQMKLGWILANGPEGVLRKVEERLDLIADTYLSLSTPIQLAAPVWLGLRSGVQEQIRSRVLSNLATLADAVRDTSCRLLSAQGGWYATLEIPRHLSEEEWILQLLDEDQVLVHPGYFFDFDGEAYLVISLLPDRQVFQEAIQRLVKRFIVV